jgi:hypothetical protein
VKLRINHPSFLLEWYAVEGPGKKITAHLYSGDHRKLEELRKKQRVCGPFKCPSESEARRRAKKYFAAYDKRNS